MKTLLVKDITGRHNRRVKLSRIEITNPVQGYEAYWNGDERIVLTEEQTQFYKNWLKEG